MSNQLQVYKVESKENSITFDLMNIILSTNK